MYYEPGDKNITEMQIIGKAVSDAGIRAPLYWFHAAGYFEEFLGHKKGLNFGFERNLNHFTRSVGTFNRTQD